MKLNRKNSIIEGIGLALILLAFGLQIFEEHSTSTKEEAHILILNEKLNTLFLSNWDLARAINNEKFKNDLEDQFNKRYKNFPVWQETKEYVLGVESDEKYSKIFRVLLYISGSILVLLPRVFTFEKD